MRGKDIADAKQGRKGGIVDAEQGILKVSLGTGRSFNGRLATGRPMSLRIGVFL